MLRVFFSNLFGKQRAEKSSTTNSARYLELTASLTRGRANSASAWRSARPAARCSRSSWGKARNSPPSELPLGWGAPPFRQTYYQPAVRREAAGCRHAGRSLNPAHGGSTPGELHPCAPRR